MDALILSCGTGGGHNAAGRALEEELKRRGHRAVMLDPYDLMSTRLSALVGQVYIRIAQRMPRLFGLIYRIGDLVRRIPGHSPVYYANRNMVSVMREYLKTHRYDVVFMPHLFPAEILTAVKRAGGRVPLMVFVATDYACIPFTEETECDYYVLPSPKSAGEFIRYGIPKEKLLPFGIPISAAFGEKISRDAACEALGLPLKTDIFFSPGEASAQGGCGRPLSICCPISISIQRAD